MRHLNGTELKRLHRERRRRTEGRIALLLDGVQQPFNVGAILRTAAAFRVEHVYLVNASSPLHPQARKTALGSERLVTWSAHESFDEAADALAADDFALIGIDLVEGAVPIDEVDVPTDVCLAVGHEDRGLSRQCLARCGSVAYIPQLGKVGSINVAAAAAIALYEAARRHW